MTSAAPARKPYRKAPPQHRETRHGLAVAPPPPAPQHDITQVNRHTLTTPPPPPQHCTHLPAAANKWPQSTGLRCGASTSPLSDSELDVSSLSSLEIPPPPLFSSHTHRPKTSAVGVTTSPHFVGEGFPAQRGMVAAKQSPASSRTLIAAAPPKGILKQPASLGVGHAYDIIRKSKSVELLDDSRGRGGAAPHPPTRSLDRANQRAPALRRSSDPPSPVRSDWNWKMQFLEEKVRFSNFLDEITCRVMSPAHLTLLGRTPSREQGSPVPQLRHRSAHRKQQASADRTRRWDDWMASMQRPGSWYQPLHREGVGQETPRHGHNLTEGAGPKTEILRVNRGLSPRRHKHRLPVPNQSNVKVGQRGRPDPDPGPGPGPGPDPGPDLPPLSPLWWYKLFP